MKNMVILVDTNILLNYLTNRQDEYLEQSIRIVEMCARDYLLDMLRFILFLHCGMYFGNEVRKNEDKI